MNDKERYEEVIRLKLEIDKIHAKTELDLKTAIFLSNEADRLGKLLDDESLTNEQRDELLKRMMTLEKKFEHEQRMSEGDDVKIAMYKKRLNEIL